MKAQAPIKSYEFLPLTNQQIKCLHPPGHRRTSGLEGGPFQHSLLQRLQTCPVKFKVINLYLVGVNTMETCSLYWNHALWH